jgi:hypothetical protein
MLRLRFIACVLLFLFFGSFIPHPSSLLYEIRDASCLEKLLIGEKQKVGVLILRHIPNGSEFIAVYQIYTAGA